MIQTADCEKKETVAVNQKIMKQGIAVVAAILLIACLASSSFAQSDKPHFKSPSTGLLFSVVPGFIVHGAGCFYAENPGWGVGLLATEVLGCYLVAEGLEDEHVTIPAVVKTPPGRVYDSDDDEDLIAIGALLFAVSWIADIAVTQVLIKKHNERERRKFDDLSLHIAPSCFDKRRMTLQLSFSF